MALPPQQFLQKKIFYLDVTDQVHSRLESRIKTLGGRVNMAFDVHEITHVVTNRTVPGVKILDPNTNQYISSIPIEPAPTTPQTRGRQAAKLGQPKPKENDILLIATKYSLVIFNQKDFLTWITPKYDQIKGPEPPKAASSTLKRKADTQTAPQDPKRLKTSTSDLKKEDVQLTTRPQRSIKDRLRQQGNVTERQKKTRTTSVEDLLGAAAETEVKNDPPPTVTKSIKQFITDTRYPWILIEDIGHESNMKQEHFFKPQNKTFLPSSSGASTFPKLNFFENTVSSPFINNPDPKKSTNNTTQTNNNTQIHELLKIDHSGFCECCRTQFSNYEQHVEGDVHNQSFDENIYTDLDKLLANLPSYQENLVTNSSPAGTSQSNSNPSTQGGGSQNSDVMIIDSIDPPTNTGAKPKKTVNGSGRLPPKFSLADVKDSSTTQKDLNKAPAQDLKRKRL